MSAKKMIAALIFLMSASTLALAQSQPNCGPAGPAHGDCYGQPYSGTAAAKCTCRHYYR